MQRNIANKLVPLFKKGMVSKLSVRGRHTRRWHTVPVSVLYDGDDRYLVSYRGESDWAKNLRAAETGRLETGNLTEVIEAKEVPVEDRPRLLEAYSQRFGNMPTVSPVLRRLPNAADHPVFKIVDPTSRE
jgi:deazaflavin-dependent oxidoreductase (nitroreductase family)